MAALWKCLKRSYNPALHPALGANRIYRRVRMSQPSLRSYQDRQTAAARHLARGAQKQAKYLGSFSLLILCKSWLGRDGLLSSQSSDHGYVCSKLCHGTRLLWTAYLRSSAGTRAQGSPFPAPACFQRCCPWWCPGRVGFSCPPYMCTAATPPTLAKGFPGPRMVSILQKGKIPSRRP